MDEEEKYCHQMLAELLASYAKAAQPYIDRLVRIHQIRMPALRISVDALIVEMAKDIETPANLA